MLNSIDDDLSLSNSQPKENFITATIDRLEGQHAVLHTTDGQELVWPIDKLNECSEGETIRLVLQTDKDQFDNNKQIAKELLNQILNNCPRRDT